MNPVENQWLVVEAEFASDGMLHRPLSEEYLFYKAVVEGDIETVKKNCKQNRFVDKEGMGVLSRNPIINIKYHFVVATAMITRYCEQNGMEFEKAFRLSDYYIQQLDDLHSIDEVRLLHNKMVCDFTNKMRMLKRGDYISKHVNDTKNYIYAHIQERIRVEDIAEYLGLSSSYLSRIFKLEMGIAISKYIIEQKIKLSMNLLRYSNETILDIANKFSFSSQSHFIKQFREYVGYTPKKYRDEFYMTLERLE